MYNIVKIYFWFEEKVKARKNVLNKMLFKIIFYLIKD